MEKDRSDYQAIAERRVRLGLLLSEIGQQNGVEVSAQEMQRLVLQAAQLRAPLYEDKVIDFLFEKAEISDRAVTREELEAAIEADDEVIGKGHVHGPDCGHDHGHVHGPDCDHDHDEKPAKKPAGKKAAAPKKAKADDAPVEAVAEEAPAPKKAPAKKAVAAKAEDAPAEKAATPKKAPAKKKAAAE
jgi:trigger factor